MELPEIYLLLTELYGSVRFPDDPRLPAQGHRQQPFVCRLRKSAVPFLGILRLFVGFSDRKYILEDVDQEQMVFYVRCLTGFVNNKTKFQIDLSETYLFGADLERANLEKADLKRADLIRANLSLVNLARANLTGANLSGAILDEAFP